MNDDLEKAKLYLDEAHKYFDFVHETRRRIDEKIYNMIVLSGVLINVVFGLGYFLIQQGVVKSPYIMWLLVFSVFSYFIVTMIGLFSYRPQNVDSRDLKKVIEKYENGEKETELIAPIQHLAWNLSRDAENNNATVIRKAKSFQTMLCTFAFGLILLIVALGFLAYGL